MVCVTRRVRLYLVIAIGFATFLMGCGGGSESDSPPPEPGNVPPGVLSISAYYRTEPPPATEAETIQRYLEALVLAQTAGANGQFSSYTWSELEPIQGSYDLQNLSDTMQHAENQNLTVLVGLQVINTVARAMPLDLVDEPWNSQTMISRMHALLDQLIPLMQGRVDYISIGNEVNGYFVGLHAAELAAYTVYFADAVDYIHTHLPGVAVGVTVTADGLLGAGTTTWFDLNRHSDVVVTTYYPLESDFRVKPSDQPLSDFPALVAFAAGKPLVLQEVGYPSSTIIGGSEARQAQFVQYVFNAWLSSDGAIPFLNLFLLHDFSDDLVDSLVSYYGVPGSNFREYLATLGLRYTNGDEKAVWPALLQAAADAGLR